jgi:hypothetical protein
MPSNTILCGPEGHLAELRIKMPALIGNEWKHVCQHFPSWVSVNCKNMNINWEVNIRR